MSLLVLAAAALSGCTVVDGDTIRCGQERIRLLGIDAPEMHDCPRGRRCVPGDPHASTDNLRQLIEGQALRIERVGQDRYGRTLGVVWAAGVNVSCAQVAGGFAIYRPDWDNGGRIAQSC